MNIKNSRNAILLLTLSLLWAGTFIFVKIADQSLSPLTIMAFRALVSTLFLFIALPITGKPLLHHFRNGRLQLVCACSGLMIAYMWLTIAYSEKTLSAAMASLLLTALVPFTWLIATFITKEKPFYIVNALGILIATTGIAIMIGIQHILHADHTLWAALLYISGLASFATAATINKTFARHTAPQATISFNLLYISVILSITALTFGHPLTEHFTHSNIAALCALSVCSTGIGYLIYFYLSHHAGLVYAAMSSYLVPIMGFGMGLFLLHESVHLQQCLGLVIVFTGMWLIQKKRITEPA